MTKAAHGNVRSAAMDTLVNMCLCTGKELLVDISKYTIDALKMGTLKMKIHEIEIRKKQGSIVEVRQNLLSTIHILVTIFHLFLLKI